MRYRWWFIRGSRVCRSGGGVWTSVQRGVPGGGRSKRRSRPVLRHDGAHAPPEPARARRTWSGVAVEGDVTVVAVRPVREEPRAREQPRAAEVVGAGVLGVVQEP